MESRREIRLQAFNQTKPNLNLGLRFDCSATQKCLREKASLLAKPAARVSQNKASASFCVLLLNRSAFWPASHFQLISFIDAMASSRDLVFVTKQLRDGSQVDCKVLLFAGTNERPNDAGRFTLPAPFDNFEASFTVVLENSNQVMLIITMLPGGTNLRVNQATNTHHQ